MFDARELMNSLVTTKQKAQNRAETDFFDENNLLICGKCKTPKQAVLDNGIIVPIRCDCEIIADELEERKQKKAKEMEMIQKLKSASLLDERFAGANFDIFQITKENERNLKLCRRYATAFDVMLEKNQGLLMWGDVGTGKSFAAACIANHLLDHNVPVIMTSFTKVIEMIEAGNEQESRIINRLNQAQLVIFDDIGTERNTSYALEKVYNIVDGRYRRRKPMIVTTNLTMKEMMNERDSNYSRIYDRLFETCYPMQFTGSSWRKKEANRRFKEMEEFLNEGEEA